MASDNSLNMPSGLGGLVRFKEEYESKFNLKPIHIVVFVILIVAFRVALPFFVK